MTRPCWLRRAVRNRHRHAIEQASRRWRGGRRGDSGRTRRKFDFHTDGATASSGDGATASSRGVVAVNRWPSQAAGEPSSRARAHRSLRGLRGRRVVGTGRGGSRPRRARVSRSSRPVSATYGAPRGALLVFRSVLGLGQKFHVVGAVDDQQPRRAARALAALAVHAWRRQIEPHACPPSLPAAALVARRRTPHAARAAPRLEPSLRTLRGSFLYFSSFRRASAVRRRRQAQIAQEFAGERPARRRGSAGCSARGATRPPNARRRWLAAALVAASARWRSCPSQSCQLPAGSPKPSRA